MSIRLSEVALICLTIATAFGGIGCATGQSYRAALAAEEKGDAATAYDYYARAAPKNRNVSDVANGLERTRASAAAESERAALAAMDEGRYGDAWRLFMRTLEIQPDHATAAQLVRRLEDEHSSEIAAAKGEWMQRGSLALAAPRRGPLADAAPTTPQEDEEESTSDRDEADIEPERPVAERRHDERPVVAAPMAASPPPRIEPSAPPPREFSSRQFDSRPVAPPERGDFLAVHTLSLEDRRYQRMVIAIDGIAVRLKDTEGDGEADLDLFNGKKRVQKVRDLEMGRSQTFRGQSGELYRLTLLGLHHKSQTVKIGVKRA